MPQALAVFVNAKLVDYSSSKGPALEGLASHR